MNVIKKDPQKPNKAPKRKLSVTKAIPSKPKVVSIEDMDQALTDYFKERYGREYDRN